MEAPHPSNIINLADRLERRLMAAHRAVGIKCLHHEVAGEPLSGCLHYTFKNLIAMADASTTGRASPAFTGVALWRVAELVRDGAYHAERLERKLRKAKKKARR